MAERAHPEHPGFQEGSPYRANLFKRYAFASRFTAGKVALDIPCGVGWGTSLLSAARRIGIDLCPDAIAYAKAHYAGIDFLVGDMAKIPLGDRSVNVIVCLEGFEHVCKAMGERFLAEAVRVLRPDGLLVMTVPVVLPGGTPSGNPHHLNEPPLQELKDLLARTFETDSMDVVAGPDGPVVYFVGRPKAGIRLPDHCGAGSCAGSNGGGKSNVLLTTSAAPSQSPFSTREKRPPIGIGFLISVLRDAGHKVSFIDNYLQPSDFIETGYLQKNAIDFVGIYANTICFRDTLRMLHAMQGLRQAGEWRGRIVVGGPHAAVAPQTIPDFVDFVVQGEGEHAMRDIVEGQVADRIVRYPRIDDLDTLPMPAWDCFIDLPYDWGMQLIGTGPVFTMNTSRGCPFHCAFCSVGSIWGRKYTAFSAERIVSDIEHLVHKYGAGGIYFREDNFTLNETRLRKFCDLLLHKNLDISWVCETRVSNLSEELVQLTARAGAKGFYFGVESGSQRMLDLMRKDISVDQIRRAFRWCHDAGVKPIASVIVGVPGETEADLRQTNELLEEIKPALVWRNVYTGIPYSDLYHTALTERSYEYIDDRGIVYLQGHNERVRRYYQNQWNACIPDTQETKDWTNKPKISVLMAVHNGEPFLRQAMESIYRQTCQDFEFVIVDDGSTDGTPEILHQMKDSRTVVHRNAENQGLTKSLNVGLRLCRGDYVARMDADDLSHPRRFEKQARLLDEDARCVAVGSWCNWIDADGQVTGSWEPTTGADDIRARLLAGNCLAHGSAMIRRACLEQANGYNEAYPCAQDYDLWLRLSEAGQVRNLGEYLHSVRQWDGTISVEKRSLQRRCADEALLDACRRRREPYVTVLTVNHNTPDFIKLCISKVFEFSDLPFEMLVVDNGSTDGSLDYLKSDKRIRLMCLSRNIGHGPALNEAMKHVRSRYVVVLDSDAHPIRKGWLSALLEPLSDEVPVSGIHHHRDYVHPACMAMETQNFFEHRWSFKPNWPKDNDIARLGVTHWDVGEMISMEVRRQGKGLHYFELSNKPVRGIIGSEYGGIVYHHFFGTRVVCEPGRPAFESATREAILDAKQRHFTQTSTAMESRQAPAPRSLLKLSVVLTTYNRSDLLEQVLAGFARQTAPKDDFEIVVIDDGSTPPVREVVDRFADTVHLKYLRQDNCGLAAARNAGIRAAEGKIVLFSDDDDVPAPELVAEHLHSHAEHPAESVVVLGHLDWCPDLTITPLMHYVTHVGGEYFGFDRLQDGQFYDQWKWWGGLVSAKRSLLESLEGPFDTRLRFGYEDTELACRLLPRQIRVLYNARARSYVLRPVTFEEFCRRSHKQGKALHRVAAAHPQVIIPRYGLENATAEYKGKYAASLEEWTAKIAKFEGLLMAQGGASGPDMDRHLKALYTGYQACFRGYLLKGYVEQLEAAACGKVSLEDPVNAAEGTAMDPCLGTAAGQKPDDAEPLGAATIRPLRIAIIDTNTPCFDMGSSSLRMHHIAKILVSQGHRLDYLYTKYLKTDKKYKAVFDGAVRFIKILPTVNSFRDYLYFNRVDDLDCVWITNLWAVDYTNFALELTAWLKANRPQTSVVIDTMDLHYKKHLRRFELSQDPEDSRTAGQFLELERRLYPLADRVLAVTEVEKRDILAHVPAACRVEVIPNIHEVLSDVPVVHQRRHMCFLGACRIRHNGDAVQWFLREVHPLILEKVPDAQFHIMGHGNEDFSEALQAYPNVKVIGYVEDAEQAVAQYRLFVCPMIYGAGMKGKLGVAASAGTPFATTTIGAEGFDFTDGQHCFIADRPQEFADKCVHLLQDDATWRRFSTNARDIISSRFSVHAMGELIAGLLRPVAAQRPVHRRTSSACMDAPIAAPQPKVSIVMACRNCQEYLPQCLDSIAGQTMREWELFLLDDGSTDDTRRIIKEYAGRDARIKPFYFDANEGPYVRRNFAIQRAATEFIVIQDADDIMSPHKLQVLYDEITRDRQLAVVGSYYRDFLHEFRGLQYTDCKELPVEHDEIVAKFATWRHAMTHMSAIIRRQMFEIIGLYDRNPFASDAFWFAKLAEYARHDRGIRLKNVPEYLTLRRVHTSNQTTTLPTIDPRNRRTRYHQYCEVKLRKIRQKGQVAPADVARELRACDCSDFLTRFKAEIIRWESEPLAERVIPELLQHCVWLFNKTFYVTCLSMLAGVEIVEPNIARRYRNYDLLRAMALFALDMKPESRRCAEREIQRHDSVAARRFLAECLENDSPRDVQNWCGAKAGLCDLHLVDAHEGAVMLQ